MDFLYFIRDFRLHGCTTANAYFHLDLTDLYSAVLPVLYPHAVLYQHGKNQTGSRKGDWLMKKRIIALLFAALPTLGFAEVPNYEWQSIKVDLTDKAALQDGARTFANYCMGCHGAKFQRYERVADDLGISEELMMENLVFPSDAKYGDHMKASMTPDQAKKWFGVAPPDLTLVARVRGNDWVYNYMRSFYVDESRPFGVNNVVFPNVGMPNVLVHLQGVQTVGTAQVQAVDEKGKKVFDPLTGTPLTKESDNELTVLPKTGTLTEAEFDQKIQNLVTFLAYSANPVKLQSKNKTDISDT